MFGSIGGTEIIVLVVIGLLVFGPRRLPELGRSIGKTLIELRRAAGDMRTAIEQEADLGEVRRTTQDIKATIQREAGRVFSDLEAEARLVTAARSGASAQPASANPSPQGSVSAPEAAPAAKAPPDPGPETHAASAEAAKGEPGGKHDA